jgi:hypothetical protein
MKNASSLTISLKRENLNKNKFNKFPNSLTLLFMMFFLVSNSNYCFAQISRTQIIDNATPYTSFSWTASSCNLWSGASCGGKNVYSADIPWVNIGTNISMPYCWGGWSTQAEHINAMANCKSAGDICSYSGGGCSGGGAGLSCASGHDCSGLVSRAWGLSSKRSTSTLPAISTSIPLSQVQPGDILNVAGSHTRLVETNYGNGNYRVIEASGIDWKTAYHTYTAAQLASYDPRCPNSSIVTGGCGSISPPSNDDCSNSITLIPNTSCNTTPGDIAGATQSFAASGCPSGLIQDVWYRFIATSDGTYTIKLYPSNSMDGIVEVRQGSCTGTVLGCADSGGGNGGIEKLDVIGSNGTTYFIRVYEYNSTGNTIPPATTAFDICITRPSCVTPGIPVSASCTSSGMTTASLLWTEGNPVGSSMVSYYWVVGTRPTVTYGNGVTQGFTSGTTALATGLSAGALYYLRVYAYTSCNQTNSEYMTSSSFTTLPCQPDWTLIPYSDKTTAYCKVTIGGAPASNNDKLGAFVGSECRGIGDIIIVNDEAYSTFNIYGTSSETVSFKIWDASDCTELINCNSYLTYPGGTIGNPPNYLAINAGIKTLEVFPTNQNVPKNPAGSTDFNVIANSSWNAVSNQAWCTVTPSGCGNGPITVSFKVNETTSQRVATVTVTVNGLPPKMVTVTQDTCTPPAAPLIGNIIQPTCEIATGSVELSGLPAGNWIINPGNISGSNSSRTISGLVAGIYNFTVINAAGCISQASDSVVINTQPVTPNVTNQTALIQSGETFSITPTGVPIGTTYTWAAPIYLGGVTGGSTQTIPQSDINGTLTVSSGTGTATYTVTPTYGACIGATFTLKVTVAYDDVTAPTATLLSPTGYTGNDTTFDLKMTMSELIERGTGTMVIYKGEAPVTSFTSAQVIINGYDVMVPVSLDKNTTYWVNVSPGFVKDLAGNPYRGITSPFIWTFTTGNFATNAYNLENSQFRVYPNPFNNYIIIENHKELSRVVLTNISGQKTLDIVNPGRKISTQNVATGIYYLSLIPKSGQIEFRKIIKIEQDN